MNPTYIRIPTPTATVSLAQLRQLASHGAVHDSKELRFDGTVAKIKIASAWAFRREASREAHQQAFVSLLTRSVQQALPPVVRNAECKNANAGAEALVKAHSVDQQGRLYHVAGLRSLLAAMDAQTPQTARKAPPVAWGQPSSRQVLGEQSAPAVQRPATNGDSPSVADFLTATGKPHASPAAAADRKHATPVAKAADDADLADALNLPFEYAKVLAGKNADAMMDRIFILGSTLKNQDPSWMRKFLDGWIAGRNDQGALPRSTAQSITFAIVKSVSGNLKNQLIAQVLGHLGEQDQASVKTQVKNFEAALKSRAS